MGIKFFKHLKAACFSKLISLGLICVTCSACVNHANTRLNYANHTPQCLNMCQQYWYECPKLCNNNYKNCSIDAHSNTLKTYNFYKNQQYIQGMAITRTLNSYSDPLECHNLTCNCIQDHNTCAKACTDGYQNLRASHL